MAEVAAAAADQRLNDRRQDVTQQEAMRALVRLNEQRVLLDSASAMMSTLSRVKRTFMWLIMCLFMWNWMELQSFDIHYEELKESGHKKCDHHLLDTWYSILIFVTPIGRILHATYVLRKCCNYNPEIGETPPVSEEGSMNLFPETMRPGRPIRVQLLTGSFLLFHIVWSIIGIYWCFQDTACKSVNPRLSISVCIMCCVMLVYVTLSQPSHLQVARLVSILSQEDAERAQAAATTAMAGCVAVELDSAGRLDGEELPIDCAICMDSLSLETQELEEGRRLCPGLCKAPCGHVFHQSCLQAWARRAGTCPLCRSDLQGLHSSGDTRTELSPELRQLISHLERVNPERAEITRSLLRGRVMP